MNIPVATNDARTAPERDQRDGESQTIELTPQRRGGKPTNRLPVAAALLVLAGAAVGGRVDGAALLAALGAGIAARLWLRAMESVRAGQGVEGAAAERPRPAGSEPSGDAAGEARAALIAALPEAALCVGGDNRVECVNAEARRRFPIPPGERPLLSVAIRHPELQKAIASARKDGRSETFAFVESDETDTHYSGIAVRVGTGMATRVLVTLRDLTEIRHAEMWRADFLANASHELRTPLGSLSGMIETLQGSARDDEDARDRFLGIMRAQAGRMSRLIDDLLILSRIELREHRAPASLVDLAELTARTVDSLTPLVAERRGQLQHRGAAQGLTVAGDARELTQTIENLIDNAIKYGGEGCRIVVETGQGTSREEAVERAGRRWPDAARATVISASRVEHAPHVYLRVSDTGPGIDRQHLPRLAERFYRVDPGRGLVDGTGLGLAIVKHTVMHHRGEFLVESAPGTGTAFGVALPARSALSKRDKHGSETS